LWRCLRFWQWIKRQHGNWGSSVGHYHPALTRRTAWPLGRNDIRRHVWRVIGRILRLHGHNEGCEQESSYEAGHPFSVAKATSSIPGWLGVSRISRSGVPAGSFFTAAAGAPESFFPPAGPSIASNDGGEIALVTSDTASPSSVARAHLYLMTEFAPTPAAPPAPRNAVSYLGGSKARIDWQSDGGMDGFLLEESVDFGLHWFSADILAPEVRTVTVPASVGNQFRVSAFGPGGLSAGAVTSIGSPQRRRAERR